MQNMITIFIKTILIVTSDHFSMVFVLSFEFVATLLLIIVDFYVYSLQLLSFRISSIEYIQIMDKGDIICFLIINHFCTM